MDVERTMEFILQSQAKAEVRMERAEARMDRMEARSDRMELRYDKRFDGLTKIVRTGMRLLNQLAVEQRKLSSDLRELTVSHKELAAAQKETQRTLKAFIDSLRKGKNGR